MQIDYMIDKLKSKVKAGGYIAYFQDNTSSYGDTNYLRSLFNEATTHPQILELAISTRPDYISDEFLQILTEIKKPVTVEIGIQSVNDKSLLFLNRGHSQIDNDQAIMALKKYPFRTGVHIILGIHGETRTDIDKTINWINSHTRINDVKIHHLAVYNDSKLAEIMSKEDIIDLESYINLLTYFVDNLRDDITISRLFTSNLNRHKKMLNNFPGIKREWMNRVMRLYSPQKNT
jgi:hypothetical protein